jgi:asparagine synthase (glutamine-hydrolysing)
MCGIAGSINQKLDISRLTRDLWHRGPDEQSTFCEGNLILHHHRLSILDISGGKQPMHYEQFTIIFNGEIYNHLDVRDKRNLKCTTNSDTETILQAYAKLGTGCLDDFDGMFALAIYDRKNNQLFLARDRAGKKPLYYYYDHTSFVFASELNALKHQLPLTINDDNIVQYIRMGYFYRSNSPYNDVYELPAGSFATVSLSNPTPKVEKWWNIHSFYQHSVNDDFDTALNKTDHFLHAAVKRRVESSDLEVGSFLSGGIDSGLITAIAKQYNSSLKTFTISFAGEYDEAPLASLVAERYQTHHHEINISFDHLLNDVETILSNYGEPFFDSSAIPSYYVSKAAREYLTVILNGDGGDEMFGGYRRYVPFAQYDFFRPGFFVKLIAETAHKVLPVSNNKKSVYNYLYRLSDLARKDGLATYLAATIDNFEGFEKHVKGSGTLQEEIENDFEAIKDTRLSGLEKIMTLDFDNILAGDLLVKMDIATMAHSLEGRSPMLGKELLEYIPSLNDKFKINGKVTKYLLRKLAEKYLPAELINQPKRGFEIPLKKWVDNELKNMINDYLFSGDCYNTNLVDKVFIKDLWQKKINVGDEKRAKIIWTLFALEVWYKKCYKQIA